MYSELFLALASVPIKPFANCICLDVASRWAQRGFPFCHRVPMVAPVFGGTGSKFFCLGESREVLGRAAKGDDHLLSDLSEFLWER